MFQGKNIVQACFTTDGSCPNNTNTQYNGNAAGPIPRGKSNHGTHVAGIAVGNYIPAKQFGGVAHEADLIAVQVVNQDGLAYNSSLLRGLNYVYSLTPTHNIAAVNLSLGRGWRLSSTCDSHSPSITSIISILRNKDVATIAATRNHRGTPWTNNPSVVRMNDWNILMATTGGKTVKFYVNGNYIGQHSSNRLIYGHRVCISQ